MKTVFYSFVAGVAVVGVATHVFAQPSRPPGPPVACSTPGVCRIAIRVDSCGQKGGISVTPPVMSIARPAIIEWTITTSGYVFAPNGISFSSPGAQFHRLPGTPPNVIRMRNDHTSLGDFYYYVDVLHCVPVDPWVINK
jgi:hypothetical protein